MRERRQIIDLWNRGNAVALVTLVRVEGSSYRRTGARLLIAADGEYAGSISGGCLEAEVIRKAAWMVRDGRAVVERYSTLFDDTADIPYGLGCGGTVDLLIEPAQTPDCRDLMGALSASLKGERMGVITWLPSGESGLRREIVSASGQHLSTAMNSHFDTFAETLDPPQRLVLFGGGDDAQPTVRFAALLGWNVAVVDGRTQWAKPARFPEADTVRVASSLGESGLVLSQRDAVVIMTHSYEQDRAWLTAVLPIAPRYVGLLGARHRSALLISEASALLGWTMERACEGIFAPVGLDLGGDGAEAIALATIAEVQACCEGKLGVSRRMTPELIANQIEKGGASRYLQAQCAL